MKRAEQSTAVVIFEGDRRLEERQKRLPPRFLAEFHEHLEDLIGSVEGVDLFTARLTRGTFVITKGVEELVSVAAPDLASQLDLTSRLLFAKHYGNVIFLAGDTPGLTAWTITETVKRLEIRSPSAVIGPAPDGGFYLFGINHPARIDWSAVRLFSSEAAVRLELELEGNGFLTTRLPALSDIDSTENALNALPRSSAIGARLLGRLTSWLGTRPLSAIRKLAPLLTPCGPVLLRAPPSGRRAR